MNSTGYGDGNRKVTGTINNKTDYYKNLEKYYSHYPIFKASYLVGRIAGKVIEEASLKYLKGKLIDIGCGEKRKKDLAGACASEYIGLDHINTFHDRSNIDIFGSAYQIPVENETYDSAICTAVLEHLEEPGKAVEECCRVLKKGGHAIYTIPLFWHLHEEPRDFYRYTRYGICYLFEKAGFEIIELKPLSGFWITFGSEFNYYIHRFSKGLLKPVVSFWIIMNNLIFLLLEKLDSPKQWTWAYFVIARKK